MLSNFLNALRLTEEYVGKGTDYITGRSRVLDNIEVVRILDAFGVTSEAILNAAALLDVPMYKLENEALPIGVLTLLRQLDIEPAPSQGRQAENEYELAKRAGKDAQLLILAQATMRLSRLSQLDQDKLQASTAYGRIILIYNIIGLVHNVNVELEIEARKSAEAVLVKLGLDEYQVKQPRKWVGIKKLGELFEEERPFFEK